ncbi:MAG: hypothetical protein WDW38_008243 [Sanguina aurantia]
MGSTVVLNVYDLASENKWMYWCGIGIYHAGVEVHGVEYAYGGHDYDYSGVFATNPRDAPGQVQFRESLHMGNSNLTQAEIHQLVQKLGGAYKGNSYHLLQRNCNHFANDLCRQLVGKTAPRWINRLAHMAVTLHCLLPPSWVPPLQTPTAIPREVPRPVVIGDKEALFSGPKSDSYKERRQPTIIGGPDSTSAPPSTLYAGRT